MVNKAEKERAILEAFKANYPDFPAGEITPHDETEHGKSDFLIGDLCIELTAYTYEEKSNQKQSAGASIFRLENIFPEIVRRAQQKFEAAYQTNIMVFIDFHSHNIPKDGEIDKIAAEVAALVAQHVPRRNFGMAEIYQHQLYGSTLAGIIKSIAIYTSSDLSHGWWNLQSVWTGVQVNISVLDEIIAYKNTKIPSYKELCKCSRAWLIITAEAGIGLLTEVPDDVKSHQFHSAFEQVFFFNFHRQQISPLVTVL